MLCRNKLRRTPKYVDLFNKRGPVAEGAPMYHNERVLRMREELGPFVYGENAAIDPKVKLEQRAPMILDDMSQYEGEWIVGTKVRTGKGVLTWPDGSIYEGWWSMNRANGRGRLIHVDGSFYDGDWLND